VKIALVHDWVVTIGGAERCLEVFRELFPQSNKESDSQCILC